MAEKGSVDKIKREAILAAQGITPLDYMMAIVRNEQEDKTVRLDAAKAAAPYVHARLQAVTLGGDPENPLTVENRHSDLEEARHLAFILSKAMKAKRQSLRPVCFPLASPPRKSKSERTASSHNPLILCGFLERAKGFEPSTPTLARLCSTPELHPHP